MREFPPKYILFGGCALAFGASCVNVVFVLEVGTSVSYMTGDISELASDIPRVQMGVLEGAIQIGFTVLGFLLGSITSGWLIHHPELEMVKPYGRMISAIGIILLVSSGFRQFSIPLSLAFGGFACGMQNALATRYRGLILRTTHLTGLLTDLGITIGMKLRGHSIETWNFTVPISLILAFVIGAIVGSFVTFHFEFPLLTFMGVLYLSGGLFGSFYKRRFFMRTA